jgi:hypothetical protein
MASGNGAVLELRLLEGGVIADEGHVLEGGAERGEAAVVGVARIRIAEVNDLLGREVLGASAGAVLVVIDDVGAVQIAARRDVLAGENPDFLGDAERIEDETPSGGASGRHGFAAPF